MSSDIMRAGVYRAPGRLNCEMVTIPSIGRDEALVRVYACGFCGTDVKKIMSGSQPPPRVFGHEIAGSVVSVGSDVTDWTPGDRVALYHHVACGGCFYCERGLDSQCAEYRRTVTTAGFEPAGGGFAEYVRVMAPAVKRGMIRIPESVDYEAAALLEPVNTCLKGIDRLQRKPGDTVIVTGLGPIGRLLSRISMLKGLRVIGVDVVADRRTRAAEVDGVSAFDPASAQLEDRVRECTEGRGVDGAVIATPSAPAISATMKLVRPGGRVVLFASTRPGEVGELDLGDLCVYDKEVVGSYSSAMRLIPVAADLVFSGRLPVADLVSHRLALSQIQNALELVAKPRPDTMKVMILPQQGGDVLA